MPYLSYGDLEVYQLAHRLAVEVHEATMELPKFEMFEEGSQLHRSSKSVCGNIAEGFGRRKYKNEFVRFLVYALASCDETRAHLDLLFGTGSLARADLYKQFTDAYDELGRKLRRFLRPVERCHMTRITL